MDTHKTKNRCGPILPPSSQRREIASKVSRRDSSRRPKSLKYPRVAEDADPTQKHQPVRIPAYPDKHLPLPPMTYNRRERESKKARRLAREKHAMMALRRRFDQQRLREEERELSQHNGNPEIPRIVITAPESDTEKLD